VASGFSRTGRSTATSGMWRAGVCHCDSRIAICAPRTSRRFSEFPRSIRHSGAVLGFSEPFGGAVGRFGILSCCTERLVHYFGFFGATRYASPAFQDFYSLHRSSCSLFWTFWCYSVRLGCNSRLLFIAPFNQFTIRDFFALHGFFLRTFGFLARIQRASPSIRDFFRLKRRSDGID